MKTFNVILFFLVSTVSFSQVGIGTSSPNPSTQLEIVSSDKGVLMPQISLSSLLDTETISEGNVQSLLVFNTNTTAEVSPGYYYWLNNRWNRIVNQDDVASVSGAGTTNTSLTEDGTDLILTDSDGSVISIPLASISSGADTNTTNASITEDGTDLILTDSDGGTVSIPLASISSGVDTNTTITSITEDGTDLILTDSDGSTVTIPLANISSGGTGDGDAWAVTGEDVASAVGRTGAVGVGTTTPGATLDVAGHIWQTNTGNSVFVGENAGLNDDLNDNYSTFVGSNSGRDNTSGNYNTAVGGSALALNSTGSNNIAVGAWALSNNLTGIENVAIGTSTLLMAENSSMNVGIGYNALLNATGSLNIAIGQHTGLSIGGNGNIVLGTHAMNNGSGYPSTNHSTSSHNIAMGYSAAKHLTSGMTNVTIGYSVAEDLTSGSDNIFIGFRSGFGIEDGIGNIIIGKTMIPLPASLSNHIIFNTDNKERFRVDDLGNMGIGTTSPTEKLHVQGNVRADSFISNTTTYPDYVFENHIEGKSEYSKDYSFKTLKEVEEFITVNKHLPGVTRIGDLKKTESGYLVNMTVLSVQTLEKVEELFLYTIAQQKELDVLKVENKKLKERIAKIEGALNISEQ